MEIKYNAFRLTEAPENNAVLPRENDSACLTVRGELYYDENDDTDFPLPLSVSGIRVRMVSEEDGMPVTDSFPAVGEGACFSATVENIPTGGPYTLDLVYRDGDIQLQYPMRGERRRHIYVGDLYLIAGQSNAAGMGMGRVEDTPQPGVQLFRDLTHWDVASFPFCDKDVCKENMFLAFAKRIYRQTGVPVGLIPGAMGGAPISRFLPQERGDLYRKALSAMKITGTNVRAVLWYQGCTDAGNRMTAETYLKAFDAYVRCIRKDLGNPDLPVYTFQLNRYIVPKENPALDLSYSVIREAQRRAAHEIPGVKVLPTADGVHVCDFIHGSSATNRTLGERLAAMVLWDLYGKGRPLAVPEIKSAVCRGKELTLTWDGVESFLFDYHAGKNLPIRVEDGGSVVAFDSYRLSGNEIVLSLCAPLSASATVSGQWGQDPKFWICDFDNQMPMLSFCQFPIQTYEDN